MKPQAKIRICPGIHNDGRFAHAQRDFCWSCAPYWEVFPTCPTHNRKLASSGYCRECRRYYQYAIPTLEFAPDGRSNLCQCDDGDGALHDADCPDTMLVTP